MRLKSLTLKDKEILSRYLNLSSHTLSAYSIANIYIWQGLFKISWEIINGALCIFFKDKIGVFLYLAPLAERIKPDTLTEVFRIMDSINVNNEISRIENVQECDLPVYNNLGYVYYEKPGDYLCSVSALATLKGNALKHKRAAVNFFLKHNEFRYLGFSNHDAPDCLKLYRRWAKGRKDNNPDRVYRAMLSDSYVCLKSALKNYRHLGLEGRLVRINGQLRAFTFGYRINQDTFCILYEVADLAFKGLSQFIFQAFCKDLSEYKFINIMDDSGLENLKRTKFSYHPVKIERSFIIKRNNA